MGKCYPVTDNLHRPFALPGKMQRENFRIAYEVLDYLAVKWNFDLDKALEGLQFVRWPARFQHFKNMIIDGGHNPDGVRALSEAVNEAYPGEKFLIVYAAFGDKHAPECLPFLEKIASGFIFTVPGAGGRAAYSPDELSQMTALPSAVESDPATAVRNALKQTECKVIVSGSLYLAGIALENCVPLDEVLNI
jgi:dihydrofolate synthase/folylpolyglutamate synthase